MDATESDTSLPSHGLRPVLKCFSGTILKYDHFPRNIFIVYFGSEPVLWLEYRWNNSPASILHKSVFSVQGSCVLVQWVIFLNKSHNMDVHERYLSASPVRRVPNPLLQYCKLLLSQLLRGRGC